MEEGTKLHIISSICSGLWEQYVQHSGCNKIKINEKK